MPGFEGELLEIESGTQRCRGTCDGQTPKVLKETWVQSEGGKGESSPSRETATDAGMRIGTQGRSAEASGWRAQSTSGWAALCNRKGGGERVKKERALTMNGYRLRGGMK